jgi:hypothetical protein
MIEKNKTSASSLLRKSTLIAFGCLVGLALVQARTAKASDTAVLVALDDKAAPALPLSVTFEKVENAEAGPYVAKLKNTSSDAITVSGTYYPSVGIHSDTKERKLPERKLASGETWSIPGLAATDKLTIEGVGFAPLNITVP